ncbi:MAG TPA: hypothetical protein VHO48_16655, partial [Anaerolineaceae bacterium]|nr:hypothetical protein [Anaerolineaceae bacterium]
MGLQGKGFWIWKIINCEGGVTSAIVDQAVAAGLTHVMIKIADGAGSSNVDTTTGQDKVAPLANALRAKGLQVWGWHYVYGYDPNAEASKAISRLQALGLDGYIVDAEGEFKQEGKATAASTFMTKVRSAFPNLPIALSSYRYPSYHPTFPWKSFLEKCDLNMPQVYWEQAHNAGTQLTRSFNEFQKMTPYRPVIPTGAAYKHNGWVPTDADVLEFLNTARSLHLDAANFFSWDECRRDLTGLWSTISDYNWNGANGGQDIAVQYISALNTRDPNIVASLYTP